MNIKITKKEIQKAKKKLFHVISLIFRNYQRPYSEEWDKILKEFLINGSIVIYNDCTCKIKYKDEEITVWIANKFYSYGHEYNYQEDVLQYRPSHETMLLLEEKTKDLIAERNAIKKENSEKRTEKLLNTIK